MEKLTGQIITRPMGPADDGNEMLTGLMEPMKKGQRVLVAVIGILAVDPKSPLNVEGRQFIVTGNPTSLFPGEAIVIFTDGSVDRAKEIAGFELGRALLEPIWRV